MYKVRHRFASRLYGKLLQMCLFYGRQGVIRGRTIGFDDGLNVYTTKVG